MKINKFKKISSFLTLSTIATITTATVFGVNNQASNTLTVSNSSQPVQADAIVLNNWTYDVTNHRLAATNYPEYSFQVVGNDVSLNEIKLVSFSQPNNSNLYSISNLEQIRSSNPNDKTKYQITDIGDRCFLDKTNLQSIILPTAIDHLPYFVFSGCTNLTNVITSTMLTNIGHRAFYGCSSLKWFNATPANEPLGMILIPESITIINEKTFSGCASITNIELPSALEFIADNAFNHCTSLTTIDIPLSVSQIGETVFNGCINLNEVNVNQEDVSLIKLDASGLFHPNQAGTPQYVIYVPSIEAVNQYEQAVGWIVHKGHYRIGNNSDQSVQLIEPIMNLYGIVGTPGTQQYHAILKPEYLNQNFTWQLVNFYPNSPEYTSEITISSTGLLSWSDFLPVGIYSFQIRVFATDYVDLMAPHLSNTITLEINNPADLASNYSDLTVIFVSVPIGSIIVATIIYLVYYFRNNHAKWWSKTF